MNLLNRFTLAALGAVLFASIASAQWVYEGTGGGPDNISQLGLLRDREVSAAATAQTFVYDIGNLNQALAIHAACSSGTATLVVSASSDNANFLTIDSLSAAATNLKNYNNNTAGGSTAVSPLGFRWIKIAVGSCGASNTSTLTIAGK